MQLCQVENLELKVKRCCITIGTSCMAFQRITLWVLKSCLCGTAGFRCVLLLMLCTFVPVLYSAESFSIYPWDECSPPTSNCCFERRAGSRTIRWKWKEAAMFTGKVRFEAELMNSCVCLLWIIFLFVTFPAIYVIYLLLYCPLNLNCHNSLIYSSINLYLRELHNLIYTICRLIVSRAWGVNRQPSF